MHGTGGTTTALARLAAVFLPAPLPRQGRVAFWDPAGQAPPDGAPTTELTVVRAHGAGVRRRTVPAVVLPVVAALPLLVRARQDPGAHPAAACWGAAALHALGLVARGRLLPGLTPEGYDAWRAGPLEPEDAAHLRAVAAALPPEGHAVPLPGPAPLRLPGPEALVRAFVDAGPTPCPAPPPPRTPSAARSPHPRPSTCRGPTNGRPRSRPGWTPGSASRCAWTCPRSASSTAATPAAEPPARPGRAGKPAPSPAARAPPSSRCTAWPTPR